MAPGRCGLSRRWSQVVLALTLCASAVALPTEADPLRRTFGPGQWVRRLGASAPEDRAGAAWLLGRYEADTTRSEVILGLRDMLLREGDPGAMLAAVGALAAGDDPAREEALYTAANDPRFGLSSGTTAVAASAIRAMGRWPDPANVRRLLDFARPLRSGGQRADVSEAVALALSDLPYAEFGMLMGGSRAQTQDRATAIRAAGLRGDARWARVIEEQLTVPVRGGTMAAIEATVRLGLSEHARALVAVARDGRERSTRRAATRALGALGGGFDPAVLRELMADPVTREAALESAGALGDPALVAEVARWLAAPWEGDRRAAAEALGAIGGERATEALFHATREADEPTRETLWHALSRCGSSAHARIASAPDTRAAHWARVELFLREGVRPRRSAATGSATAAIRARALSGESVALEGLSSESADVRAATAAALGDARGGSDALAARLSREDDEGVRAALVLALGAVGDRVAREALAALVAREGEEPSVAARVAAAALGALAEFSAAPALRVMARAHDAESRAVARWALGVIHDPAAIGALEAAVVTEVDTQARGAALIALARLWGVGAEPSLRWAARTAGSVRMDAMVSYAETITRGGGVGVFVGESVVRVADAPPRSVWALDLPDGGVRYGVAAEDGVVLIAGAPSAPSPLRRVW